jgi:hypothetical protein
MTTAASSALAMMERMIAALVTWPVARQTAMYWVFGRRGMYCPSISHKGTVASLA